VGQRLLGGKSEKGNREGENSKEKGRKKTYKGKIEVKRVKLRQKGQK
jgi:hypothetical protein